MYTQMMIRFICNHVLPSYVLNRSYLNFYQGNYDLRITVLYVILKTENIAPIIRLTF